MKKLLLISGIVGTVLTANAWANSGTGDVQATIYKTLAPLNIIHMSPVRFGEMISPLNSGEVLVAHVDVLTNTAIKHASSTGGDLVANSGAHVGSWEVYAAANEIYTVAFSNLNCPAQGVTLTEMEFISATHNNTTLGKINSNGFDAIRMGGKLSIESGVSGAVACTYDMTLNYQ